MEHVVGRGVETVYWYLLQLGASEAKDEKVSRITFWVAGLGLPLVHLLDDLKLSGYWSECMWKWCDAVILMSTH